MKENERLRGTMKRIILTISVSCWLLVMTLCMFNALRSPPVLIPQSVEVNMPRQRVWYTNGTFYLMYSDFDKALIWQSTDEGFSWTLVFNSTRTGRSR